MKKGSKPNDWKIFVDSQAKSVSYQDFQEKNLERFSKNFYRSEIQTQLRQKNEKKYLESLDKKKEGANMKLASQYEELKKLGDSQRALQMKNSLYNDYLNQINSKTHKIQFESSLNKELEKSILRYHSLAEQSAKALVSLKKSQRISSYQQYIAQKSLEKIEKEEDIKAEKLRDQDLVSESIERFDRSQVEYRKKLKDIERRQMEFQKTYIDVQRSENLKARSKSELVSKWETDKLEEMNAKEAVELEMKMKKQKSQGMFLRSQIQEKFERGELERFERSQEKKYSDITVVSDKLMKDQEKMNENEFKRYYNNVLQHQISEKEIERFNENTFNDRERMINMDIIDKFNRGEEAVFVGVPGMHRRQTSLKSSLLRANLTGSTWFSPEKTQSIESEESCAWIKGKSCERSFCSEYELDDRHDPILNPVGSKKNLNQSFHRGKGLSSLFN